jgi:hypothetical protein
VARTISASGRRLVIEDCHYLNGNCLQDLAFILKSLGGYGLGVLISGMMKGGDWAFGCQLVDGALGALHTPPAHMPIRIFTPQVLAPTGAKLRKSLLREHGKGAAWPGTVDDYVDALVWLVSELLANHRHFFRSFTFRDSADS